MKLRSRLRTLGRRKSGGLPVEESHGLDENKRYWDKYAGFWTKNFQGYETEAQADAPDAYRYLGEEWANPEQVEQILESWVFPYIGPDTVALEIGSGGGRVAGRVAPLVKHLYCMDISSEMLKKLTEALADRDNVTPLHVEDAVFPDVLKDLDFIYSFDVFVHLDLHTQWKYIRQAAEALRPGGAAFFHTTNLRTHEGWKRFSSQERATLDGHYFVMPETVRLLAAKAGFRVEKESTEDPDNFYTARDYLVLLRR